MQRWVSFDEARVMGCDWWKCGEEGRTSSSTELQYESFTENHNRPVLKYPNGDMYVGGWAKCRTGVDKPQGVGVFLSFDLIILVGQWHEGHLQGYARQLWLAQSNIWRHNYDPLSCIKTDNGVGLPFLYFGHFQNSQKNDDKATVVLKDGTTRIGPWKDDVPVGDWWQNHTSSRTPVWEIKKLLTFTASEKRKSYGNVDVNVDDIDDDVDTLAAQDGEIPIRCFRAGAIPNDNPPLSSVVVPAGASTNTTPRSCAMERLDDIHPPSAIKDGLSHAKDFVAECRARVQQKTLFSGEARCSSPNVSAVSFTNALSTQPEAAADSHELPHNDVISPLSQLEHASLDGTLKSKQRKGWIGPKRLEVLLRHKMEATFSDVASTLSLHHQGDDNCPWGGVEPKLEPFQPPSHVVTRESRDASVRPQSIATTYRETTATAIPTLSDIAVDGIGTDYLRDRIAILSLEERDLEFAEIDVRDDLFTISNLDVDSFQQNEDSGRVCCMCIASDPYFANKIDDESDNDMNSVSSRLNTSPSHIVMGYGGELFDFSTIYSSNNHQGDTTSHHQRQCDENEELIELDTQSSLKSMKGGIHNGVDNPRKSSWFEWLGT